MAWHTKSADKDLYFCENAACRVISFIPGKDTPITCPTCNSLGQFVRPPVPSHPVRLISFGE